MHKIFTSSYHTPAAQELITSFVRVVDPTSAIEIGTQQGMSAILIGKGMTRGTLHTYDLYEPQYRGAPYLDTHAEIATSVHNIHKAGLSDRIQVHKGSYEEVLLEQIDIHGVGYSMIDLLHIDICNHYDNLKPMLDRLSQFVSKAIILEGGIYNNWQKKHDYKNFRPLLEEMTEWDFVTIPFNEHNSVTLMTRKP